MADGITSPPGEWLKDMAVVVTGAASGMGAATANLLWRAGCPVMLSDSNAEALEAVASAMTGDGEVTCSVADVRDELAVQRVMQSSRERFGKLDGVIHFAGMLSRVQLEELTERHWDDVLDVNLKGSFFVARQAAEVMVDQGFGSIVLTSSDSARMGSLVSGPAYAASKGGVIALTRTLAKYLGPRGVRLNAISPGLTMTGMSQTWEAELIQGVEGMTPLGRLGEPGDMAAVAAFLVSRGASYMSGEVVEVNGGVYFD